MKLYELMLRWEQLYSTPNQEHVLKILVGLVQTPFKSLETIRVEFSTLPMIVHIVHDLASDDEIQFRNCLTGQNEGTRHQFLACWIALKDDPTVNTNKCE